MPIKLKEEHKETYVAFGKGNKKLGERDDLYVLARLGKNNNRQLLQYFDGVPTDEDIEQAEEAFFNEEQARKQRRNDQIKQRAEDGKKKPFVAPKKEESKPQE